VGPGLAEAGQRRGVSTVALTRGREVYLSRCTRCHGLEPIDRYPARQWKDQIIPAMALRSHLSPDQTSDLEAYVLTAHEKLTGTRR